MGDSRRFMDDLAWAFIRLLLGLIRRLDVITVGRLARCLGWTASHLLSLRKSVSFLNLDVVFADTVSPRRKRQVFRRAAGYIMTMGLETIWYCYADRATFVRNVKIVGLEHLAAAKARGRGVVLAGGHVGAFTFVAARLTSEGYPSWVILRFTHDARANELYLDMMARLGVNWIADRPRTQCIKSSLARLLSNDILHVLIDQKPSRGKGCVVPFFGIPTEMFPGAISLALKTGASVLPVTIHRSRIGATHASPRHHVIEIGAPIEIVLTGDRQKDIEVNLAKVVKSLEVGIRNYPEEWWVISRRWSRSQLAARER